MIYGGAHEEQGQRSPTTISLIEENLEQAVLPCLLHSIFITLDNNRSCSDLYSLCDFRYITMKLLLLLLGALLYTTPPACAKLYTWITVALYKKIKSQSLQQRSEQNSCALSCADRLINSCGLCQRGEDTGLSGIAVRMPCLPSPTFPAGTAWVLCSATEPGCCGTPPAPARPPQPRANRCKLFGKLVYYVPHS